jgi:hypothetical protein
MVRFAPLASLALLLAAPAPPARAAGGDVPKEPGVYWEQSVEMQMTGFAMPAQTTRVCIPKKGIEEPPRAGDDQKCRMSDVKRTGQRMTWKVRCEDGTTGEGDITSTADSFAGTMTMRTEGQEMRMKVKGKRVGGDCDANETKRQVAGLQRQAEQGQAEYARARDQMCREGAEKLDVQLFVPIVAGVPPTCPDASGLCSQLDTRRGLVRLRAQSAVKDARAKVEKLCKQDVAALEKGHCAAAAKEQERSPKPPDPDTSEFVFSSCPDLAKTIAKRDCAGRKYTAMPPAQREFCTRWAEETIRSGQGPAAAPPATGGTGEEPADQAPKKAKGKKKAAADEDEGESKSEAEDMKSKIMKGLFGR